MLMNTIQPPIDAPKSCPICLEEFLDYGTSSLGCMPCNHIFHQQCIVGWLRKSHYCPLCRFEMPTSPTDS
ncbi:hypothetical protein Leryth_017928 [Lithospermum erythrorhizon]|nr:hypothetical protein Leryth_017928 [Lithospermum erythrorhizon]